ncbi:hypothetical protein D3C80_1904670 [compost metagenome]
MAAREAVIISVSHMMTKRVKVTLLFNSRRMPKAKAVYQDTPETAPDARNKVALLRETPKSRGRLKSRSASGNTNA